MPPRLDFGGYVPGFGGAVPIGFGVGVVGRLGAKVAVGASVGATSVAVPGGGGANNF